MCVYVCISAYMCLIYFLYVLCMLLIGLYGLGTKREDCMLFLVFRGRLQECLVNCLSVCRSVWALSACLSVCLLSVWGASKGAFFSIQDRQYVFKFTNIQTHVCMCVCMYVCMVMWCNVMYVMYVMYVMHVMDVMYIMYVMRVTNAMHAMYVIQSMYVMNVM